MGKEWILNLATNRWGLNKKTQVGPVAEWIREVSPRSEQEWAQAYFQRLQHMLQQQNIPLTPEEHLRALGERLYVKITEVIQAEIEDITLEDCLHYIQDLVIHRTFEGYQREIDTVYGQLQHMLGIEILPAPDEIDRRYNVDFWIEVQGRYIGLQIKPITYHQMPQSHRWHQWMHASHQEFEQRFGGKVFIIFSTREGRQKRIANPEVIPAIQAELQRLQSL